MYNPCPWSIACLQVPAFALTPTALQLSAPDIAYGCAALPASASV